MANAVGVDAIVAGRGGTWGESETDIVGVASLEGVDIGAIAPATAPLRSHGFGGEGMMSRLEG